MLLLDFKSKLNNSQIFVAFLKYLNFIKIITDYHNKNTTDTVCFELQTEQATGCQSICETVLKLYLFVTFNFNPRNIFRRFLGIKKN